MKCLSSIWIQIKKQLYQRRLKPYIHSETSMWRQWMKFPYRQIDYCNVSLCRRIQVWRRLNQALPLSSFSLAKFYFFFGWLIIALLLIVIRFMARATNASIDFALWFLTDSWNPIILFTLLRNQYHYIIAFVIACLKTEKKSQSETKLAESKASLTQIITWRLLIACFLFFYILMRWK